MKFNGRNIQVSSKARIGKNVSIGDNTIIYDGVDIGDNSVICNDCILGEPVNDFYYQNSYQNPKLIIGENALIRSHCIVYAGSTIGTNFTSGHRVIIRENTEIGDFCSIGTLSDIQGEVKIGDYCRLHSNVHLAQKTILGHFVFMYPYSIVTNDPHPPSEYLKGSCIGNYSIVGVHSIILPGIKIGENCFIGANSVVNRSIKDYTLVSGEAAQKKMDVRDIITRKGRYYPWMYQYDKRMPWEGIGFELWKENNKDRDASL